ncbi:thiamine-phosphate kinase [Oceanicaulis alexandrii]|uniref:thiamine-phosphate kinase n=1 Tax=Oceanicaulis alexandrii TaxID=153233 RepID=UPI0035CF885C
MSGSGEFDYIRTRLAPLSLGLPGAAALTDDGAVLTPPEGCDWAVTADTLIEGRHFPHNEDPALAARKALRANLSDLAAMGADPHAYMACVVWPDTNREARMSGFADGLALDQDIFGVHLAGGDTTSAPGPWMISITAFGSVPKGQAVRRSGAKPGDQLLVTGTIGDAGLGLKARQGIYAPPKADVEWLAQRFTLPEPRCALSGLVRQYAHAAIDVSDGLLADARHIAEASRCMLELNLDSIPLSDPARHWLTQQPDRSQALLELASGGDDYELVLTMSADIVTDFITAASRLGVAVTRLGEVTFGGDSDGGLIVKVDGEPITPSSFGFTHF